MGRRVEDSPREPRRCCNERGQPRPSVAQAARSEGSMRQISVLDQRVSCAANVSLGNPPKITSAMNYRENVYHV